jgi:hypothetical protein
MAGGQTYGIEAADFLGRASEAVSDRAEKHGAIRKTFENLALQWSAFLQLLGHPVHLKASEAAEMMQLLKTVRRHNGTHNEDDDIDNIAYGAIVGYLRAIEEEERLGAAEARVVAVERVSKLAARAPQQNAKKRRR